MVFNDFMRLFLFLTSMLNLLDETIIYNFFPMMKSNLCTDKWISLLFKSNIKWYFLISVDVIPEWFYPQVARRFVDPSLDANIHLHLVKFYVLESDEVGTVSKFKHFLLYLSFIHCNWTGVTNLTPGVFSHRYCREKSQDVKINPMSLFFEETSVTLNWCKFWFFCWYM